MRRSAQQSPPYHLERDPYHLESDIAKQGFEAEKWLAERKWILSDNVPVQLAGDEVAVEDFTAQRLWLSSLNVTVQPQISDAQIEVILPVQGSFRLDNPHGGIEVASGEIFVIRDRIRRTLFSEDPVALVSVKYRPPMAMISDVLNQTGIPVWSSTSYSNILVSSLMAAFDGKISPIEAAFREAQLGIEYLATALLLSILPTQSFDGAPSALNRAIWYMHTKIGDSSVSLNSVANDLSFSVAYLTKIFASTGLSPMRYLRKIRTEQASRALDSIGDRSSRTMDAVAQKFGFRNARALKYSLKQHETSTDYDSN